MSVKSEELLRQLIREFIQESLDDDQIADLDEQDHSSEHSHPQYFVSGKSDEKVKGYLKSLGLAR